MNDNEEFIQEFLEESDENLDQLDRDFVALEGNPHDRDRLASLFRTIHTIKGTSGFFAFSKLGAIAHVGENLLSRLRDGEMLLDEEITSALLESVDAIRQILAHIKNTGEEGDGDYRALNDKLTRLQSKQQASAAAKAEPVSDESVESPDDQQPTATADAPAVPETAWAASAINARGVEEKPATESAAATDATSDVVQSTESLALPIEETAPAPRPEPARKADTATAGLSEGSIRVDVGLLNRLMNLVGELVLARNQLRQCTQNVEDRPFLNVTQRLNQVTTELQEGVMKTRMQPIGNIWGKFPRVVRDLAVACGKEVHLEMEGQETELDRSLLEAIKDPLTHLIRNAVDHGIETPAVRTDRGKPQSGTLLLRAFHEGGQVNLEITDDGGGINAELIKRMALDRSLITHEQAAGMSAQEVVHLIFHPGFSTVENITDISGRGVGMDVVRTNIERIGGTINLQSRPGQGTTVRVKIPLTLAIIPALIVTSGGDRFAIPQVSLLELLSFSGKKAQQAVEMIHDTPVHRLRGQLLPLVFLNRELQLEEPRQPTSLGALKVVVLNVDDHRFGLVVDGINDTEEIVVKPLNAALSTLPAFSGATIMGDGRVVLILDVNGLARSAGMTLKEREPVLGVAAGTAAPSQQEDDTLLLCEFGGGRRIAVPLAQVARLEEFPIRMIERAVDSEVVQYRGAIMPLVRLSTTLGHCSPPSDSIKVVVSAEGGQTVGVVVDNILDVVRRPVDMRRSVQRGGMLGSIVIDQRVTDIVDLASVIQTANVNAG
jgi:two-component system chemotaxis sensor kinase CheA